MKIHCNEQERIHCAIKLAHLLDAEDYLILKVSHGFSTENNEFYFHRGSEVCLCLVICKIPVPQFQDCFPRLTIFLTQQLLQEALTYEHAHI